jgi:glucosamine--fructose-6-phosphate aminotransferase (isomerizing)
MPGIFALISKGDVVDDLVSGLERLECRGDDSYGSAGLAVNNSMGTSLVRVEGKLRALRETLKSHPACGSAGIAQTRAATREAPSLLNMHPHRCGKVTVVRCGFLEEHAALKEVLISQGNLHDTDINTEVIPHLIDRELTGGASPLVSLQKTLTALNGPYAIALMIDDQKDLLYVARKGSPLAIGYGQADPDGSHDVMASSDAEALRPLALHISHLEEGDFAVISRLGVLVFDHCGNSVMRSITPLD